MFVFGRAIGLFQILDVNTPNHEGETTHNSEGLKENLNSSEVQLYQENLTDFSKYSSCFQVHGKPSLLDHIGLCILTLY